MNTTADTTKSSTTQSLNKREAFEKWVVTQKLSHLLYREGEGYDDESIQGAWTAWQHLYVENPVDIQNCNQADINYALQLTDEMARSGVESEGIQIETPDIVFWRLLVEPFSVTGPHHFAQSLTELNPVILGYLEWLLKRGLAIVDTIDGSLAVTFK